MARARVQKRAAKYALPRSKKMKSRKAQAGAAKLRLVPTTPEPRLNAKGKMALAKQLADESGEKKLSSRLLEKLESHRQKRQAELVAAKPKGRRGRRPKVSLEYVPEHQDEEAYVLEQELETLQYDTGIPVPSKGEESGPTQDRPEEFDEELNFDW